MLISSSTRLAMVCLSAFFLRPRLYEDIHDAATNGRAVGGDVVEEIDLHGARLARPDHLDRLALDVRLAAAAADGAENLAPSGDDHLRADLARRRAFGRDDRRDGERLALVEKLFHLMID